MPSTPSFARNFWISSLFDARKIHGFASWAHSILWNWCLSSPIAWNLMFVYSQFHLTPNPNICMLSALRKVALNTSSYLPICSNHVYSGLQLQKPQNKKSYMFRVVIDQLLYLNTLISFTYSCLNDLQLVFNGILNLPNID